jgi:hypothetical protein
MALTVTGLTDSKFYPANNPMLYTLSSTNTNQQNFRYIADIYINGSSTYNRIEVVAHPTYSSGVVDISGIVQSFLTSNANDNTTTFKQCSDHVCSYVVQFGEQYGASSGVTTYPGITSKTAYAFNGVFNPIDYLNYNPNIWVLSDVNSQWLTDCPRIETTATDKLNIGFLNLNNNDGTFLEISTYEADGSFQETSTILNPYYNGANNGERSVDVNVGYAWLSSLVTGDLASGTAPIIESNTAYYTIKMLDAVSVTSSETLTIYIVDQCTKNNPVRFKFMNNYGKYDYFTFLGASKKNTDIKRNNYKSDSYKWSSVGYLGNSKNRGTTQFETKLDDTINVQSDWITQAQSIWLEQLLTSPDVYVYEGSNLVAVNIIDSNYATRYEASEQLFNLSLSFKYNYNRVRQRR